MSILQRLFGEKAPDPNRTMRPLYLAIIAKGRELHWYEQGQVPDTLDGRFDMISSILALVLLRMEDFPELRQQSAWLTEIFVEDMDAQMREAGIGDVVIAKDMGKVMGVLGGRLGAFRESANDAAKLNECIRRNIFEGEDVAPDALGHVTAQIADFQKGLASRSPEDLLSGQIG